MTFLIILLVLSVIVNFVLVKTLLKVTAKGRAALKAIAALSNYVQDAVVSSETIDSLKEKIGSKAQKAKVESIFLADKVSKAVEKDLKALWAKGEAKINKLF